MATWILRRFASPDTLRAIHPDLLLRFLDPHREFLADRGVALPPPGSGLPPDYAALTRTFLSPDARTPAGLIDALYFVDELATADGMAALLREAERRGLDLDLRAEPTPADVAVLVWLRDPDVVERQHAEQQLGRARSFVSYQTAGPRPPTFRLPSESQLAALAAHLDGWFDARRRGRGSRILIGGPADAAWFLVRHGQPIRREESLDGPDPAGVCYRPVKYDVVAYVPQTGELRVHAGSQGERELYRAAFGEHLFGDPDAFPGAERYTLEPLRIDGEAALACGDVPGIEWVTLREIQLLYGGQPWELVTRKSDDLFKLFAARGSGLPAAGRLVRAVFRVKFAGTRTPRSVVIKPANVAQYARDGDSTLVEQWLAARGFAQEAGTVDYDPTHAVLAGS